MIRENLDKATWTDTYNDVLKTLRQKGAKRIYLSHDPKDENFARAFASRLKQAGYTVIVAADARPHKDGIKDKDDEEIVAQVIASCDTTLVLGNGP